MMSFASEDTREMNSTQQSIRISRASLVIVSPGGRISDIIFETVARRLRCQLLGFRRTMYSCKMRQMIDGLA